MDRMDQNPSQRLERTEQMRTGNEETLSVTLDDMAKHKTLVEMKGKQPESLGFPSAADLLGPSPEEQSGAPNSRSLQ